MFCNFDGCYSKRVDSEGSDVADSVGRLLRRLHDSAQRRQSEDVRAQQYAMTLDSDSDIPALDDDHSVQWVNRCCPGTTLAKIRR